MKLDKTVIGTTLDEMFIWITLNETFICMTLDEMLMKKRVSISWSSGMGGSLCHFSSAYETLTQGLMCISEVIS